MKRLFLLISLLLNGCAWVQYDEFQSQIPSQVMSVHGGSRCVYDAFNITAMKTQPNLYVYAPLTWAGSYSEKDKEGVVIGSIPRRGYAVTITIKEVAESNTIAEGRFKDLLSDNENLVQRIFSSVDVSACH